MFSQTIEYALRAVVCLAHHGEAMTAPQVAAVTKLPSGYLSKVLQSLVRAGLLSSQRGLHGGFTLARAAEELSILEVINAVDPIRRIRRCPVGLASHQEKLCPLHQRLDDAIAQIESAFAASTVRDLLTDPSESRPLNLVRRCPGPSPQPAESADPAAMTLQRTLRIEAETMLPDLLREYPGVRPVLDRYGLRGCGGPLGPAESVGYFARAHGVELSALLEELRAAAANPAFHRPSSGAAPAR